MSDLADGESVEIQGSAAKPYLLKNTGGVYSCSCPAWRNQSIAIEKRTCKHLRKYRGDAAETERIGSALPQKPVRKAAGSSDGGDEAAGTEPPILLAEAWDNSVDLGGWWMSEKLDGVRAYWDGQQFLSRQGNVYHAPDWFLEGLPNVPLDGELWMDRKAFQRTVSIVRRQDKNEQWKTIRYLVFDAPAMSSAFEDRIAFLKESVSDWKNGFVTVHPHELCRDVAHLRDELQRVESLGGEGLMLRQPGSIYVAGRSSTLLKVKTFHDAEATVIRHEPGKGRHAGRLGALAVRLPDGTEFSVGTGFSDRERESPPPVGSLIQFRYQELSDGGVPRFPSYVGRRTDVVVDVAHAGRGGVNKEIDAREPRAPQPRIVVHSAAASAQENRRLYFEFVDSSSSKFWEIALNGSDVTTRWGRIGSDGQSKTKSFGSADKARAEYDKLVSDKTDKGYVEVGGTKER
ncbi:MAG: DNA ligase [Planctomycetaceae bacterium]|nr:DNA ligase [Planctomycetaceae bacterium]